MYIHCVFRINRDRIGETVILPLQAAKTQDAGRILALAVQEFIHIFEEVASRLGKVDTF